jgi:hypothetical protein
MTAMSKNHPTNISSDLNYKIQKLDLGDILTLRKSIAFGTTYLTYKPVFFLFWNFVVSRFWRFFQIF